MRLQFTVTDVLYNDLTAAAEKRGMTLSNLIRQYAIEGLKNDGVKRSAVAYRVRPGGKRRKDDTDSGDSEE